MKPSNCLPKPVTTVARNNSLLLILAVLCSCIAPHVLVAAEPHRLPAPGFEVDIEAEDFAGTSPGDHPKAEDNASASGRKNLGYFWWDTWFEIEVEGQQLLDYEMVLMSSSPIGTSVEVQLVTESGELPLTTITVPKTESWSDYTQTAIQHISLPSGSHTLRFKNVGEGANVDTISFRALETNNRSSVKPAVTTGPDINPLKGFSSGWWRPRDDFASVGFQYIEWRHLEPVNGQFDWDYLEQHVLNRAGSQGRHLILQLVVDWDDWNTAQPVADGQQGSAYRGPSWLKELMGNDFERRGRVVHNGRDRIARATSYDHPVFQKEAQEAIQEVVNHFKNDPRGFVVQVGVLGFWGEWHNYPQDDNQADPKNNWSASPESERAILGTYMKHLGDDLFTQVRYPDVALNLEYAKRGMGYSNGSVVPTEHGREFGQALDQTEGKLWRNGPVGGEWPPGINDPVMWQSFFNGTVGMDMIQEARYSTILAPEVNSEGPNSVDIVGQLGDSFDPAAQFMTMHRAMGYNFQAVEVRHLAALDQSNLIHIEVDLHNAGVAPFYKNWDVQLAVLDAATKKVVGSVTTSTDIRTILEQQTITVTGSVNAELNPSHQYQVALRIIQPNADKPKPTPWKLKARNVYVGLANDTELTPGKWQDGTHRLVGGWNVMDDVKVRSNNVSF